MYNIKLTKYETFSATQPPNGTCKLTTNITFSRDKSKEADLADGATLKIYTDDLGQDGMAGTAAVLFEGAKSRRSCITN